MARITHPHKNKLTFSPIPRRPRGQSICLFGPRASGRPGNRGNTLGRGPTRRQSQSTRRILSRRPAIGILNDAYMDPMKFGSEATDGRVV